MNEPANQLENRHTKIADQSIQRMLQEEHGWPVERAKQITFRNITDHPDVPHWVKNRHKIIMEESAKVDTFYQLV